MDAGEAAGRDPSLDGLRGIAVLLVIAIHLRLLGCGWIGVQLFFVLSGFLITRILVQEAGAYPFWLYLKRFYIRRVVRILPVFYLYLGMVAVVCLLVDADAELAPYAFPAAFFHINLAGLFSAPGTLPPLSHEAAYAIKHLWSLAVEEHFYLLWPLLIYAVGRHRLLTCIAAALLAGPLLRALAAQWLAADPATAGAMPWHIYFLSTSHVDAFGAGALAAYLSRRQWAPPAVLNAHAWIVACAAAYLLGAIANQSWGLQRHEGLPFTLGFPVTLPSGGQYIWGYTVLNLLAAQLILLALQPGPARRMLSRGALVFTGRISYGLYLFHMPALIAHEFAGRGLRLQGWGALEIQALLLPAFLGVTMGAAWLSWRFYERPWLRLGRRWQQKLTRAAERHRQAAQQGAEVELPAGLSSGLRS